MAPTPDPGNTYDAERTYPKQMRRYPFSVGHDQLLNYVRRGMPSVLFIGSAQARFQAGREEMLARMAEHGAVGRVVLLSDTPHTFGLFAPWLQPTVDAVVAFLDEHLHPGRFNSRPSPRRPARACRSFRPTGRYSGFRGRLS